MNRFNQRKKEKKEKETTSRKWPQYMTLISYTELYDNAWSIENAAYLQAAAGFSSDSSS